MRRLDPEDLIPAENGGGRERRCVATGEQASDDRLVRFVLDPNGIVTPDVAAKLPGRGVWVMATRAAVTTAVARNGFARGLKKQVTAPADLPDQVERLLVKRSLDFLGMARRAGELVIGAESVEAAIRQARPAWLIEASDGASDGRDKLLALARGLWGAVNVAGCFTAGELGVALGRDRVVHAGIPTGRLAHRWTVDIGRLSGFRALMPADWAQNIVD